MFIHSVSWVDCISAMIEDDINNFPFTYMIFQYVCTRKNLKLILWFFTTKIYLTEVWSVLNNCIAQMRILITSNDWFYLIELIGSTNICIHTYAHAHTHTHISLCNMHIDTSLRTKLSDTLTQTRIILLIFSQKIDNIFKPKNLFSFCTVCKK